MNELNFEKITYGGSHKRAEVSRVVLTNQRACNNIIPRLWNKQQPRYKFFKKWAARTNKYAKEEEEEEEEKEKNMTFSANLHGALLK